jgi:hypothetical protein
MRARSHFFTIFKNLALSIKVCILHAVYSLLFSDKSSRKNLCGAGKSAWAGAGKISANFSVNIFENL